MRRQFLEALAELRPMIKTCWEVLLRAEPPASPLGNPDTLVFMMDRTLDTFFTTARSPTPRRWLARHPLLCSPLGETCSCQRNPLLRYFVSGEQAILAIAGQAMAGLTPALGRRGSDPFRGAAHLSLSRPVRTPDLLRSLPREMRPRPRRHRDRPSERPSGATPSDPHPATAVTVGDRSQRVKNGSGI